MARSTILPLPDDFKVICIVCGEALHAKLHFAPGQLKKKSPKCRACAPNKFSNQRAGGQQSKRENKRVIAYRCLAAAGAIRDLQEQVPFELIPTQRDAAGKVLERACTYVADVVYTDPNGVKHVVDVKGFRTEKYRIKKKMMLWVKGIRIEEE